MCGRAYDFGFRAVDALGDVNCSSHTVELISTRTSAAWLDGLADATARSRIAKRLARVELGLMADAKSVGGGVSEMRVDYRPGYRVYFTRRGQAVVVLLCGGDNLSQKRDIKRAQAMAADL